MDVDGLTVVQAVDDVSVSGHIRFALPAGERRDDYVSYHCLTQKHSAELIQERWKANAPGATHETMKLMRNRCRIRFRTLGIIRQQRTRRHIKPPRIRHPHRSTPLRQHVLPQLIPLGPLILKIRMITKHDRRRRQCGEEALRRKRRQRRGTNRFLCSVASAGYGSVGF